MKSATALSLLKRHEILSTSSPQDALATMAQFGARVVRPLPGKPFQLRAGAMKLQRLLLAHGNHGAGTNTGYDTGPHFWQSFVVNGKCLLEASGSTAVLDHKNWSALVGPHRYLESRTSAQYQQFTVKIDQDAVEKTLAAWSGNHIVDIQMQQATDMNSPTLQSMRRAAFFLAGEMDAIESNCSAMAVREFEQVFLINFLLGHRHNYTSLLLRKPAAPSSSQLDAIEDYIRENTDKPLDVEVLAKVANVSARSIFRHFRERRGSSPAQYIKTVRLEQAHRMLLAADDQTSVIRIAARAGFLSPGHFARDYRAKFGEKPSDTIGRALGRGRTRPKKSLS